MSSAQIQEMCKEWALVFNYQVDNENMKILKNNYRDIFEYLCNKVYENDEEVDIDKLFTFRSRWENDIKPCRLPSTMMGIRRSVPIPITNKNKRYFLWS